MQRELESVIPREVNQKDKNKYVWNLEKWYNMTLFAKHRDTGRENTCMDTKGEGWMGETGRLGLTRMHY